jgi:hypothetical protein
MTRGETAFDAGLRIVLLRWLIAHPWLMLVAWVVVPWTWMFAFASYWLDGSWPQFDGITLTLTLSEPLLALPLIALLFRRALEDLSGPLGFMVIKTVLLLAPLTLLILAFDALILLASVRLWAMTGQFMPAL